MAKDYRPLPQKEVVLLPKPPDWQDRWVRNLTNSDHDRLAVLDEMIGDCKTYINMVIEGDVNVFYWSGPEGLGKSHISMEMLEASKIRHYRVKGKTTAFQVHHDAWYHRRSILLLDDATRVVTTYEGVEQLKDMAEMEKIRYMRWKTGGARAIQIDVKKLNQIELDCFAEDNNGGVPSRVKLIRYPFFGRAIVCANPSMSSLVDADQLRPADARRGLRALQDRIVYYHTALTDREYEMLWLERMCAKEAFLYRYGLTWEQEQEVLRHLRKTMKNYRHLSVRTLRMAGLWRKNYPDIWRRLLEHRKVGT